MGTNGPNAEAIEAWDTVLFEKYGRFRHIVCDGIASHGEVAMDRLALRPGARVLDLGCGYGDATCALARRIGPTGEAVGVDSSRRFIQVAAEEAKAAKIDNIRFGVRDIQTEDLGGPYDVAFSRMGTMFFSSPVSAFRNVHRSLAPGGTLCMVVYRKREDVPYLSFAEKIVRELVPDKHDERGDAVTCGPGPFSMAGPDMVSEQLVKAGFERISFERSDQPTLMGRNADEAIEFALALGPAGEIIRLAGEEGERKKPDIVAALKAALEPLTAPDGTIRSSSSTWIITATPKR